MKFKKLTAFVVVATMVVGSSLTAFAGDNDGVTGAGVVEYDDSTAVVYDSVTVPTLNAEKYNFEIDPTGRLHEYDADQYVAGSVYFSSVSTPESIKPNATKLNGDKLYYQTKTELSPDSTSHNWEDIVTATTNEGVITVSAITDELYVWVPVADASVNTAYTNGKNGEYKKIDKDNYSKWFKVVEPTSGTYELALRSDYKAGTDVCDGNIYQTSYAEIAAAGIVEGANSDVKVEDYATVTTTEGVTTVTYTNVYTRGGSGTTDDPYTYTILAANSDKMDYTPEESTKNNKTDYVNVTNKSTKVKKVKAVITMSNATGLTFKASDAYEDAEAATSVYFAATDGTTPVKFVASDDGTKATATYEVDIPAKTGGTDITYQTTATNAAGGHVYKRYEGPNPIYTTKAFYIQASANTKAEAKTAWETWAKGITATTRPSINIVYTVSNVLSDADAAAEFKTTYATILAKTTATVEASDLATIEAALAAYGDLTAEAKALLITEKDLLDELKAAAEAPAVYLATSTISADANIVTMTLPDGVTFDSAKVSNGESDIDLVEDTHFVLQDNGSKFGVAKTYLNNWKNASYTIIKVVFSDGVVNELTIE
jgi:hypothetical protein